jgi:hypothetical protein
LTSLFKFLVLNLLFTNMDYLSPIISFARLVGNMYHYLLITCFTSLDYLFALFNVETHTRTQFDTFCDLMFCRVPPVPPIHTKYCVLEVVEIIRNFTMSIINSSVLVQLIYVQLQSAKYQEYFLGATRFYDFKV